MLGLQAQPAAEAKAQGKKCVEELGRANFGWNLEYAHGKQWGTFLEKLALSTARAYLDQWFSVRVTLLLRRRQ